MNWSRQVVHVAAKDARMLRWFAALYLALVLLWPMQSGGALAGMLMGLLLLAGVATIALVVQADSPVRSDAFWISRPLSAQAVFAAKLLFFAALVALAALGDAIALFRHAVDAGEYPGVLARSALLFAAVLGTGLALGTVTRDLRSFGFAWIMAIIGWFGLGVFADAFHAAHIFSAFSGWMVPLIVVGSLAVTAYQYGTGRRPYAVLLLVVIGLAAAALNPIFADERHGSPAALPATLRAQAFEVALVPPADQEETQPAVAARVPGVSPALKYVLEDASMDLVTRDGQRRTERIRRATLAPFSTGLPTVAGAKWIGDVSEAPRTGWVKLHYRDRPPAGSTALQLRGRTEAWQGRLVARMALRVGSSVRHSGRIIRIVEVSRGDEGLEVNLALSAAGLAAYDPLDLQYALLDRSRNLLFPLSQGSTSGGNSGFPLPLADFTVRLRQVSAGDDSVPPQPGTPMDLLIFRWRMVGSYPVVAAVRADTAAQPAGR